MQYAAETLAAISLQYPSLFVTSCKALAFVIKQVSFAQHRVVKCSKFEIRKQKKEI